MKKKLCEFLKETMQEKSISYATLCKGLCTVSAFSKYLNYERRMDRLLTVALMQRLGLSADAFSTLLTENEVQYFAWRQRLVSAQLAKDWDKAEAILAEEIGRKAVCNAPLQEQFYLLMRGYVLEKRTGGRECGRALFEEAAKKTIPDFPRLNASNCLLSMQEITVLMLWQERQGNPEVSVQFLSFLEKYVRVHYSEEREIVKIYPKIVAKYLPYLYENEEYATCYSLSEKIIEMMISTAYASSMETVLEYHVQAADKLGIDRENLHRKKVQLDAWKGLMQELSHTGEGLDDELFMMDIWQEAESLHEMLARMRQYRGISQEKLSEGICSPETISRIESARRAPNDKNFKAFAQKLSMGDEYYYSAIEVDDWTLLDLDWKISKHLMNAEWEQAGKMLAELEDKLDVSIPRNRQYIEEEKYIVRLRLNPHELSLEQQFSALRDILAITVENVPTTDEVGTWSEKFWEYPFGTEEIVILVKMADVLSNEKKLVQQRFLLEKLLEYYKNSSIPLEFHFRNAILILQRLSYLSAESGDSAGELYYSEEGIRLCIASGTRKALPFFVNNKADALEHLGQTEESMKYYEWAFYCYELFQKNKAAQIPKRSYEKLYGKEKAWY